MHPDCAHLDAERQHLDAILESGAKLADSQRAAIEARLATCTDQLAAREAHYAEQGGG